MNIQPINEQKEWNIFFNVNSSPTFHQSWEWGELQQKQGYDILRLGMYDEKELAAITLVEKIKAKRGSFLFIPHGPVFNVKTQSASWRTNIKTIIQTLQNYLVQLAKKEGYSFIRIAPILENIPEYQNIFKDLGFKQAPIYMHAERTWLLDLDKSEEELLAGMRKTTRYLIKKAERDGVTVEKRTDKKAIDIFWTLYQETARRENFVPFSKEFIRQEFETFNKTNNCAFLFGKVNQDYLGSVLIIFTKSSAFYHQGASIHTKFPVPYRLQWEAIKEAIKRGCIRYNFWGILQKGRTPKNWDGLTLFKTGFGGRQIDYVSTQDYVITPIRYYFTYLYEIYLRWRRGV